MTLPMIRKIHEEYGVPPEVLIQDYPLERTGS
jgi:antitoxin component HigA of HigAB toxin-antitoxin module